jgi:hypothetical protein
MGLREGKPMVASNYQMCSSLALVSILAILVLVISEHHMDFLPHGQVYHSSFVDDDETTKACGCPLLPLKTHIRGPAPAADSGTVTASDTFSDVLPFLYDRL